MLTTDARCTMSFCQGIAIYRMIGKCANCGADPILVLLTSRHKAIKVECPTCKNETVDPTRLARDDEFPEA